ncbi:hypothetical protein [Nonomuraea candida]|uniref:PIN-like domain-containing protein n=1 Tax=Nonomuraea candida TaxID=359159 RepID=UPI0012F87232|nr:hypothetical protein [Nonomuraea candida]
MSPPEQPRKFFVDRSLGRVAVPKLLREAGWNLVTLAEHYGVPQDETVEDTRWIEDSAKFGWAVLMKDKRIRYRQAEIAAVIEHQARCFVITRGDLTSAAYAERFTPTRRPSSPLPTLLAPSYTPSTPIDWSAYTPHIADTRARNPAPLPIATRNDTAARLARRRLLASVPTSGFSRAPMMWS